MPAGLGALDDQSGCVRFERSARLLAGADRDEHRQVSLTQTCDPLGRYPAVDDHQRGILLHAYSDVGRPNERDEEIRRDGTPGSATVGLFECGGERLWGHHADGSEPSGG